MGIALIILGLFLWFVLGFNGSVGTDFVDRSFSTSAFFMVITGAVILVKLNWNLVRVLCVVALVCYLPMIWQRFNFSFGINWSGVIFDIGIVIFMFILIIKKSNKSLKSGTPKSGAP